MDHTQFYNELTCRPCTVKFAALAAGKNHSMAVDVDGKSLYACGINKVVMQATAGDRGTEGVALEQMRHPELYRFHNNHRNVYSNCSTDVSYFQATYLHEAVNHIGLFCLNPDSPDFAIPLIENSDNAAKTSCWGQNYMFATNDPRSPGSPYFYVVYSMDGTKHVVDTRLADDGIVLGLARNAIDVTQTCIGPNFAHYITADHNLYSCKPGERSNREMCTFMPGSNYYDIKNGEAGTYVIADPSDPSNPGNFLYEVSHDRTGDISDVTEVTELQHVRCRTFAVGGTFVAVQNYEDKSVHILQDNTVKVISPPHRTPTFVQMHAGHAHLIALDMSGCVWVYGDNSKMQLEFTDKDTERLQRKRSIRDISDPLKLRLRLS